MIINARITLICIICHLVIKIKNMLKEAVYRLEI